MSGDSKKVIDSKFLISLGVGLAIQAAGIVWWASKDVDKNSSFTELWPAGKWGSGSLPDDVKQTLKIEELEKQMDKVMSKLYNGDHAP